MKYNILHPKRRAVFKVFVHHEKVSFTLVEKETGLRSNEVAYLLAQFISDGIVEKTGPLYQLSKTAEMYVPFFVDSPDQLAPLPVVLVAYRWNGKILLLQRDKKPYLGLWGLPGGRIRVRETIEQASQRILAEKVRAKGRFSGIHAVAHEHHDVRGVLHAYILILVSIEGSPLKEIPGRMWVRASDMDLIPMIPSDKWLCKHKLSGMTEVTHEVVSELDGAFSLIMSPDPL